MTRITTKSAALLMALVRADGFSTTPGPIFRRPSALNSLSDDGSRAHDSNSWMSSTVEEEDWETTLNRRQDGSYWSATTSPEDTAADDESDVTEKMLDILASQEANEVTFIRREAERADKMRQMEEWGFDRSTIASTLDVSIEEKADAEMETMRSYLIESYLDMDDPLTVESHTTVQRDSDTNQPTRSQMVYVDEHACVGCTK